MKSPCANCPFRSDRPFHLPADRPFHLPADRPFHLPADRVLGIGHALANDGAFNCHKNLDNPCIGAISVLDRRGDAMANVWVRMAARFGAIDYPIDHNVPVYESFEEAANALSRSFENTGENT